MTEHADTADPHDLTPAEGLAVARTLSAVAFDALDLTGLRAAHVMVNPPTYSSDGGEVVVYLSPGKGWNELARIRRLASALGVVAEIEERTSRATLGNGAEILIRYFELSTPRWSWDTPGTVHWRIWTSRDEPIGADDDHQ